MTHYLNVLLICDEARPVSTQFIVQGGKEYLALLVDLAQRHPDARQLFVSESRGEMKQYVIKRITRTKPHRLDADLIEVTGLRLKGFSHIWTV